MYPNHTESSTMESSPLTLEQCAYSIENGRVTISIGRIASHRDSRDISGTLSVELWALDGSYSGRDFGGIPLAGTTIGEMLGQHFLTDCRYDLVFKQPPDGTWHLTLMLREWTAAGYITRDYVNFAPTYVVGTGSVMSSESDNLIDVELASEKKAPPVPAEIGDRVHPADAVANETSTSSGMDQELGQGASLSSATPEEISTVKETSDNVEENIVAERPSGSIGEPLRAKGERVNLLQRLLRFFSP
jgi:hypothetical protein